MTVMELIWGMNPYPPPVGDHASHCPLAVFSLVTTDSVRTSNRNRKFKASKAQL